MTQKIAGRRWSPDGIAVLGVVSVLAIIVLIGLPLFWVLLTAFSTSTGAGLSNLRQVFSDPTFFGPLITTLVIATSVAFGALVIATPLAWIVSRTDVPLRRTIRVLVLATFAVPPFLGAVAWELLAAPNSGLLNVLARKWFGMPPFESLVNIYTMPGLIFVSTCYTFAFAFTLIATALDSVPTELEEAAAIFGASRLGTLRQITLPLILPAFAASALVAFLHAMVEFGAAGVLALPAGFNTVTTKIWSMFSYPPNPQMAAAASIPLLLITAALLLAQTRLIGRRGYTVIAGRGQRISSIELRKWKWPVLLLCMLLLTVPVFLPLLALVQVAFHSGGGLADLGHWSLDNVSLVFVGITDTEQAFVNTLKLGLLTATVGTILAFSLAYVVTRRILPGSGFIGIIAMAPAAVPSIVLAVGMFQAYTRPPIVLYGTLTILLLAFVTIQTPASFQQIRTGLRGLHPELEEAARILGASRFRAVSYVVLPLLKPVLLATWCFIFAGAIRELSAAILLFTSDTETVPVLIYDLNEGGRVGAIAVLGLSLLVLTLLVIMLANLVTRKKSRV